MHRILSPAMPEFMSFLQQIYHIAAACASVKSGKIRARKAAQKRALPTFRSTGRDAASCLFFRMTALTAAVALQGLLGRGFLSGHFFNLFLREGLFRRGLGGNVFYC